MASSEPSFPLSLHEDVEQIKNTLKRLSQDHRIMIFNILRHYYCLNCGLKLESGKVCHCTLK